LPDIRTLLAASRDSWFKRAIKLFDRTNIDETVWENLEELLISADVGIATTEKLISKVKLRVKQEKISSGDMARAALKTEMVAMLSVTLPLVIPASPPRVIMVVGVNGGGKTTSAAKLACLAKKEGKRVLMAAGDTFRAAAIDQIKNLGAQIGVEVIAHQPGADAGAVVFDALQAARNRQTDEVIIDTAGRLHTKFNLMEELKKVNRVVAKVDGTAPHEVVLVLDATTGQNGLTQAKHFKEAVAVNSIFLTKLDGTARGGIVLSISDELAIPIRFIGVGDNMEDIAPFDPVTFIDALFSE
jgi:fused signal recognition particle receptor